MDKLFIDINVVLDVVLDREVDGSSAAVMNLIDEGKAQGLLSATSYTTIYYLTNKYLDNRKSNNVIKDLLEILRVSTVDEKTLTLALNEKGQDFEDNIQIVCAQLAKADYIITRNLSHFKYSSTKALSPTEYLKHMGI
jgi:predicted nucleic acid-binding protein